jgi:hypothetical protein
MASAKARVPGVAISITPTFPKFDVRSDKGLQLYKLRIEKEYVQQKNPKEYAEVAWDRDFGVDVANARQYVEEIEAAVANELKLSEFFVPYRDGSATLKSCTNNFQKDKEVLKYFRGRKAEYKAEVNAQGRHVKAGELLYAVVHNGDISGFQEECEAKVKGAKVFIRKCNKIMEQLLVTAANAKRAGASNKTGLAGHKNKNAVPAPLKHAHGEKKRGRSPEHSDSEPESDESEEEPSSEKELKTADPDVASISESLSSGHSGGVEGTMQEPPTTSKNWKKKKAKPPPRDPLKRARHEHDSRTDKPRDAPKRAKTAKARHHRHRSASPDESRSEYENLYRTTLYERRSENISKLHDEALPMPTRMMAADELFRSIDSHSRNLLRSLCKPRP